MEILLPSLSLSTRVGLALLFQISSICWASGNGRCEPTDCSQTPRFHGDASFPCSIGRRTECDAFSYPSVGKAKEPVYPVQLASYNVYMREIDKGSHPTLNVSFQLPANLYSLQRTKAVKIEVESPDHQDYKYCRLFNFENVTFTQHDVTDPRVINYPCYYGLIRRSTYTFTVSSLPDNVQMKYYITTPDQGNKWTSSLAVWQPNDTMELWVMFDEHPGIHDYMFSLYTYDHDNCGQIDQATLVETKTQNKDGANIVVFNNLQLRKYFLTLTLKNCDTPCEMTKSHCVPIRAVSQQKEFGDGSVQTRPGSDAIVITHVGPPQNDKMTKTILGVFCGVTFGVILVVFLGYCYRDKGIGCVCLTPNREIPGLKQTPTVLLLYSPDFDAHKNAVEKFANLLMQGFDCTVRYDMFELKIIQDWGLDSWLKESIKQPNFVIFVCTTGGRLECGSNTQRLRFNKNHPLEDYFSTAVRYVHDARTSDLRRENVAVVSFSYATNGDIPHQLDTAHKFPLREVADIEPLYRFLHYRDKMPHDNQLSSSIDCFMSAMAQAKTWLDENPNCYQMLSEQKHVDKHFKKPTSYHGPVLNNAVTPKHGTYFADDPWLENCQLSGKNRSFSQPSSLHSSSEVLRKLESSKSLACLDRHKSHGSADSFGVRQSLLNDVMDSDSEIEENVTRSRSMQVDIHHTGKEFEGESPPPKSPWTSCSEDSDIAQSVMQVIREPNFERIRKIVNPNSYVCQQPPPGYAYPPIKELESIPVIGPSPNNIKLPYCTFTVEAGSSYDC